MNKKIRELIDDNLKDEDHPDCVTHAYIDGFLTACWVFKKINQEEQMELYNKYTDTNYF